MDGHCTATHVHPYNASFKGRLPLPSPLLSKEISQLFLAHRAQRELANPLFLSLTFTHSSLNTYSHKKPTSHKYTAFTRIIQASCELLWSQGILPSGQISPESDLCLGGWTKKNSQRSYRTLERVRLYFRSFLTFFWLRGGNWLLFLCSKFFLKNDALPFFTRRKRRLRHALLSPFKWK